MFGLQPSRPSIPQFRGRRGRGVFTALLSTRHVSEILVELQGLEAIAMLADLKGAAKGENVGLQRT